MTTEKAEDISIHSPKFKASFLERLVMFAWVLHKARPRVKIAWPLIKRHRQYWNMAKLKLKRSRMTRAEKIKMLLGNVQT
jgi:hypothetical protein